MVGFCYGKSHLEMDDDYRGNYPYFWMNSMWIYFLVMVNYPAIPAPPDFGLAELQGAPWAALGVRPEASEPL